MCFSFTNTNSITFRKSRCILTLLIYACLSLAGVNSECPHLSKVEDEAVSLVEAAPGQLHLLGTDVAFPFDLVQSVHRPWALRPPEAWLHTTLLREEEYSFKSYISVFSYFMLVDLQTWDFRCNIVGKPEPASMLFGHNIYGAVKWEMALPSSKKMLDKMRYMS